MAGKKKNELTVVQPPEIIPAELSLVVERSGLQKGNDHALAFAPFNKKVSELAEVLPTLNSKLPTLEDSKKARECRLALVKNRTATVAVKDERKSALIIEGKLIQDLQNVIVNRSLLIEKDLEEIEKFVEKQEQARIEKLKTERLKRLEEFDLDTAAYDFGKMDESTFQHLVAFQTDLKIKKEQEAIDAAIAGEKERQRQAELQSENDRLKKIAEEAEVKREKVEKENKAKLAAIEESNRKAREKAAKEQQAQIKKMKEAQEKADRENQRLAEELKQKEAQEKAREDEKALALKKAAMAPDKDKLQKWLDDMALPELQLQSRDAEVVMLEIAKKFSGFKSWASNIITEKL